MLNGAFRHFDPSTSLRTFSALWPDTSTSLRTLSALWPDTSTSLSALWPDPSIPRSFDFAQDAQGSFNY
jgi:hypothetical protein